jgi:hypothetical protein
MHDVCLFYAKINDCMPHLLLGYPAADRLFESRQATKGPSKGQRFRATG